MIKEIKIQIKKHQSIDARLYIPKKIERAVICCHGFALVSEGPSGLFVGLAKNLIKKNIMVVFFYFREFQYTKKFNLFNSFEDLRKVIHVVKEYTTNIDLVGHSLGGLVSLVVAEEDRSVQRLVLWAPPLRLRVPKNAKKLMKKYAVSPLQVFVVMLKLLFARKPMNVQSYFAKLKNRPVLFVYGTEDQFSSYENINRLEKYNNIQYLKVIGMDHYFTDYKKEVLERTLVWIDKE